MMSAVCGLIDSMETIAYLWRSAYVQWTSSQRTKLELKLKFDIGRYEFASSLLQQPTSASWVVEKPCADLVVFLEDLRIQRRMHIANLTQYWSQSVGSTFHEPSRHWIQRTMFGRCPRQQKYMRTYRLDPRISEVPIPNPGIENLGPGLQSLISTVFL